MKTSFSCKHSELRAAVEGEIERHLPKLERILKRYAPDLVQLHGSFDRHPRKTEFTLSLTLSLPTGTLHTSGQGADVRTGCKQAFAELELQLKKHQGKLRKDYEWKRKRPLSAITAPGKAPAD
jgi:ribosomal subunit interface protein